MNWGWHKQGYVDNNFQFYVKNSVENWHRISWKFPSITACVSSSRITARSWDSHSSPLLKLLDHLSHFCSSLFHSLFLPHWSFSVSSRGTLVSFLTLGQPYWIRLFLSLTRILHKDAHSPRRTPLPSSLPGVPRSDSQGEEGWTSREELLCTMTKIELEESWWIVVIRKIIEIKGPYE